MPQSYQEYSGSSLSATTYSVTFKYLAIDDVHALGFDGNSWTTLTLDSTTPRDATNKTITLASAPTSYTKIRLYRATATTALVDFQNGSRLSESDLDTAYQQGLFVAQEVAEDANTNQFDALRDTSVTSGTQLSNFASQSFTATAGQTEFTITSFTPQTTAPEAFVVSIDGAIQAPSAYTVSISLSKITFSSGVPVGAIVVIVTGVAASSATTVDNSTLEVVTSTNQVRVKDGGITPAKLSHPNPISWSDGALAIHKAMASSSNNSGLEIGYGLGDTETGIAYIDFHSTGATNPDWDGRILHYNGDFDFYQASQKVMSIGSDGRIKSYGQTYANLQLIAGDNTTFSSIDFGDAQDDNITRIVGDHSDNSLQFFTNDAEAMRISSSGRLQIGTTASNPASSYSSSTPNGVTIGSNKIEASRDGGAPFDINRADVGSSERTIAVFRRAGTQVGSITVGPGNATDYNESSDYRLKEDIVEMEDSIERVKELKPVNFAWKVDGTRLDGFIAHELQEVIPGAVTGTKDAVDDEGNPEYQGISQAKLVPLLTKALQEALTKIESLEARVEALENA